MPIRPVRYATVILSLLITLPGFARQEPAQNTAQTSGAQATMQLYATDKAGGRIETLRKEDIRFSEDGSEQTILNFERQQALPLAIALLIDASSSQEFTINVEKKAAHSFIDSIMHPQTDALAVISFSGKAYINQDLTGNPQRANAVVEQLRPLRPPYMATATGKVPMRSDDRLGSTAIWDTIFTTCEDVLAKSSGNKRRVIILISDGEDTSSLKKRREAIEQAIKSDVTVYSIGIVNSSSANEGVNRTALNDIAKGTGGRVYFPRKEKELSAAFAEIEDELRQPYVITYVPTGRKPGSPFHKVHIELTNPDMRKRGVQLSYRNRSFDTGH